MVHIQDTVYTVQYTCTRICNVLQNRELHFLCHCHRMYRIPETQNVLCVNFPVSNYLTYSIFFSYQSLLVHPIYSNKFICCLLHIKTIAHHQTNIISIYVPVQYMYIVHACCVIFILSRRTKNYRLNVYSQTGSSSFPN